MVHCYDFRKTTVLRWLHCTGKVINLAVMNVLRCALIRIMFYSLVVLLVYGDSIPLYTYFVIIINVYVAILYM